MREAGSAALETRFDRRLRALAWVSLALAAISGAGWLIMVGSRMSGLPAVAVVQQGVVGIVIAQTRFGHVWAWRAVPVIVLVACLALDTRSRKVTRWIGLLFSSALVASIIWAGHGSAADDLPFDFLHFPADLLHLLATGAWLGSLAPLALLLAETRREGIPSLAVAQSATVRFSVLGVTCVGVLIVTGIVNTWFLSGSIPALVGTLYGRLLLVKVAIFLGMIAVANVNRTQLVPSLERAPGAVRTLLRNALAEASLGTFVLGIVGIIGVLAPGLHTEPVWPFPYKLDLGEVAVTAQKVLDVAALLFLFCVVVCLIAAQRRRYRGMAVSLAGVLIFGSVAGVTVRPGIVTAYPTSYFAPTQAYAAPSVASGAPLYLANCTPCHGVDGRGDGPIAKSLPIAPADLTEEHIFAHSVGDIFWWISHGKANGVMPAFASTLSPEQRWDVINFVLARAAGVQTKTAGSQITAAAAPPLPDFAFEQGGAQNTLGQTLKGGPVLLVVFTPPAPQARLAQLAALEPRLAAAGLHVIAVDLGTAPNGSPLVVQVANQVRDMLALFRSPKDGSETEMMLDRNGSVRARWTASGKAGLADDHTLLTDAVNVAKIPAAAANHAGHGG